MNSYIRLSDFASRIGAGVSVLPGTGEEAVMLQRIEQMSREWDGDTRGNRLYASLETRYYRGTREGRTRSELIVDPVASLTSVDFRPGTGEEYTPLVEGVDYW